MEIQDIIQFITNQCYPTELIINEEGFNIKEFTCPVNLGVIIDPYIDECGHLFCKTCIEKCLQINEKCPLSFNSIKQSRIKNYSSLFYKNLLSNFEARCYFFEQGCKFQGKITKLLDHYQNDCLSVIIQCPNQDCTYKQLREYMTDHQLKCGYKRVECQLCQIKLQVQYLDYHIKQECQKYLIRCECGIQLERQFLENHKKYDCQIQFIFCDICQNNLIRSQYETHIINEPLFHFNSLLKQMEQKDQQINMLEKQNQILSYKVETLESLLSDEDLLVYQNKSLLGDLDQQLLDLIENCQFKPNLLKSFQGHNGTVWSVAITKDTKYIISASGGAVYGDNNCIKIWNMNDFKIFKILLGHSGSIYSICLTPNENYIVSGSADRTIRFWNLQTFQQEFIIEGHQDSIWSIKISNDGKYIASGSNDAHIKISSVEKRKVEYTLEGHTDYVFSVDFSQDSTKLISSSEDKTIRIWNLLTKQCLQVINSSQVVASVAISPNNMWFASGGGIIQIQDEEISTHRSHHIQQSQIHHTQNFNLIIWDFNNFKTVYQFKQMHKDYIWKIIFTPDSQKCITASGDKTVKVWDLVRKCCEHTIQDHTKSVRALKLSKCYRFLVTGSEDKMINVYKLFNDEKLRERQNNSDQSNQQKSLQLQ